MSLLVIAFFSGVLTVLAPCVLPLLPIILGSSIEDKKIKYTPYVIIASLSISILIFSILLKATTLFIGVPSTFWKTFSGGLIMGLGIITIFPNLWKNISDKLKFSGKSNDLLNQSSGKNGYTKYVFMGFALGPVFSSCSPTYALILAIILPAGFAFGFIALVSYILGLAAILLAISLFGKKLIKNLAWASNPNGIFKKILGLLFILIGLSIFTGFDKKIEAAALDIGFLNTTNFEQKFIDELKLDEISQKKDHGGTCEQGSCETDIEGSLTFLNPNNILTYKQGEILAEKGYSAPNFRGLSNWINSDEIKSIQELRGKVVMIDFWNMDCVNCIQTHPDTNKLYDDYSESGLIIIGIHAPEFSSQRNKKPVQETAEKYNLQFPIALDNDYKTMKTYNNNSWPASYLIDKQGYIRYVHKGIGGYDTTNQAIMELLSE